MEKMLAECEYKRWRPAITEQYFIVNGWGIVTKLDASFKKYNEYYEVYNCFKTKKEAETEAEKIVVRRMLEDIARRLNKGKDFVYNELQEKYYIFWNAELDELNQQSLYWTKTQGVVYCLDENFLNVAIQEIGEKRLKNYLRGE